MNKAKRAAIYLRVSTDRQSVENQNAALSKIAHARGWQVIETFSDVGISGSKGRDQRPGLDGALKAAQRGTFDVLMAWSIDRVGRSLIDLLGTIQHLEACGVDLFLEQQSLDTTVPAGKLMFQVVGAFAEFERSMIRERVNAGLKRAVANGVVLGRRPVEDDPDGARKTAKAKKMLKAGTGINKVAKAVGLANGTVSRIKEEMAAR